MIRSPQVENCKSLSAFYFLQVSSHTNRRQKLTFPEYNFVFTFRYRNIEKLHRRDGKCDVNRFLFDGLGRKIRNKNSHHQTRSHSLKVHYLAIIGVKLI